ncbi:MAG: hypothetical protein V1738_02065 [Patescibacteria group bacterium]
MQREKTYVAIAAAVLVAGTAVASYSLTRLYWPCVLVGGPTVTRTVEAPGPEPEQPACPECGRQTYRDSLVDLPNLSAGWVYAVNAGEDYLLAHPEGWEFVEESEDWRVNSYSLISPDTEIVLSVSGTSPSAKAGLNREEFDVQKSRMESMGTLVDTSDGRSLYLLPDWPAYGGHADYTGLTYLVMAAEDRYFIVRTYSPTGQYTNYGEIIVKIVKSLRTL